MKIMKVAAAAVSAFALLATPVVASAAESNSATTKVGSAVAKLGQRSSASVKEESKLAGTGLIIGILAAAAVIGGIVIAADDDDDISG